MRNIFFLLSLLIISGCEKSSLQQYPSPHLNKPCEDRRLSTLHELFLALDISVEPSYEAMNAFAQAHWLRSPGQERWNMKESIFQSKATKIISILKSLGMIDRVDPSTSNPDYAVILGATVYRMRTRMQHMLELIEANTFLPKEIIILTGERPLDSKQEPSSLLLDNHFIRPDWQWNHTLPKNESEAASFIWDQLPKPASIKGIPVIFISTPMLEKNGKPARPTTVDTLETWLSTLPKPGSIVAFSDNPYILYQHETMKPTLIKANWLKNGGTLETVGLAYTPQNKENIATLLDNLARYIYSILQVQKALKASAQRTP